VKKVEPPKPIKVLTPPVQKPIAATPVKAPQIAVPAPAKYIANMEDEADLLQIVSLSSNQQWFDASEIAKNCKDPKFANSLIQVLKIYLTMLYLQKISSVQMKYGEYLIKLRGVQKKFFSLMLRFFQQKLD
jgi:hypothetical protein